MQEPEERRQGPDADDTQVAGVCRSIRDNAQPVQNERSFACAYENRPDEG
jgi:hypothetical protein